MSDWQCSNCLKVYTNSQQLALRKVKAVETDTDPMEQHGYVPVCTCGKRFHLDKWRLQEEVEVNHPEGKKRLQVSTIALELDHGYVEGEHLWYETMIFGSDDQYMERYETQEQAENRHKQIVELIKAGHYKFTVSKVEYSFELVENMK